MTAGEIKSNIDNFKQNGRPAQAQKTTKEIRKANPTEAKGQVATHAPDCCLGNDGSNVSGFGDARVNSSIGAQNKSNQSSVLNAVSNVPADAKVIVNVVIDDRKVK